MRDPVGWAWTTPGGIGVLPALGSGLTDLQRSGQHERLLDVDLLHCAMTFEEVHYFSYFDERLETFTQHPVLRARVQIHPNRPQMPAWPYALWLSWRYRHQFARCRVLRVEQFTGVIPALIARAHWGIPFVVTYGYDYAAVARANGSAWKPSAHAVLRRVAMPRAAAVIVPNATMARQGAQRWPRVRITHIPNGVDGGRFLPLPRWDAQADPVVLYVGRLSPEKNLFRLVDALATLRDLRARLVLVGDGPEAGPLRHRAEALGVPVEFAGVVPQNRVPEHLRDASCFVLPSFTEGHPKALLEAMACAKPCVVASGGHGGLIEDGRTGISVDPHDVAAMGAAIRRVLTHRAWAQRLGEAASAEVLAKYDLWTLMAEEMRVLQAVAENSCVPASVSARTIPP